MRKIDVVMDFSFIYDLVKDLYKAFGRESIDLVVLVKSVFIQYIFGIPSMRKNIEEIEENFAYRWFFKKYEYVYDEYYDCDICPEN